MFTTFEGIKNAEDIDLSSVGTKNENGGRQVVTSESMLKLDLDRSGINVHDMNAYLAGVPELTSCKLKLYAGEGKTSPGFVIPYYDITGERVPFYRIRVFEPLPGRPKYLQPPDTSAYIYYPKQFGQMVKDMQSGKLPNTKINGFKPNLLVVEGEKKAAKAAKEGFLCIGLGGVYNWRSRTIILPEDTKINRDENTGMVTVKLPSSGETHEDTETLIKNKWAIGFQEAVALANKFDMNIVIVFDTDYPEKIQVQKAASSLGFELRSIGVPMNRIRQLKLPQTKEQTKIALDDFLTENGPEALVDLLHEMLSKPTAFPVYPNMREYVNGKLAGNLRRDEAKDVAAAILTDMDANGTRLKDADTGTPYYFDGRTKTLMRVSMLRHTQEPLHESSFGRYLYKNYDLSQADSKVLPWLASSFTGEDPVYDVRPFSVSTVLPDNTFALQLGDGEYIRITGNPSKSYEIVDNGTNGVLFKGDQVEQVNLVKLKAALDKQLDEPLEPWWYNVLEEFKFARDTDRKLATLIFYAAPWLLRWKGTQLPIELMIGEPGSGKSSMYMLRMQILTGRSALRNQPADIRDWYSSVTGNDGLHVTDNVHFVSKEIKQRLSDELCRLTTEPTPYIELRKLYTTSENYRIPVRSVFAMTAIQQPFTSADIIQRAAIFELNAVGGDHDSDWVGRHLRAKGGREGWIAHHLVVIHKFLHQATTEGKWNTKYKSQHRLVNYEQVLSFLSEIVDLGTPEQVKNEFLRSSQEQVSEYDWTMEALKEFSLYAKPKLDKDLNASFNCKHIVDWALSREEFKDNQNFSSARKLSRYLKAHLTMVRQITGMVEVGKVDNSISYRLEPVKSF